MTQPLHRETSKIAIDFAESMVDDGLWTAHIRGRASAARTSRMERVADICALQRMLEIQSDRMRREGRDSGHVDAVSSDLALEISGLAREAVADGSMRLMHFDPWTLTNAAENDGYVRQDQTLRPVAMAA